jgi:hypothetical protein
MSTAKKDVDQQFALPYPSFLKLLETDSGAALAEFERGARLWLSAHPTETMRSLTAAEQQDVIEETVQRCLAKDGEPLRNYTDMWGSFGNWLANVAETTGASRYPRRATKPKPNRGDGQEPTSRREDSRREPRQAAAAPPAPPGGRTAARGGPSTQAAKSVIEQLKSPRVFVPAAVVVIVLIALAFRAMRPSPEHTRAVPVTTGPIDVVLLSATEAHNSRYDLLELENVPAGRNVNVPTTAVFRSGRLTVLRLVPDASAGRFSPTRVVVENQAGEIAWESPIDPEFIADGSLNLRIDPHTIVPDDYTIRVINQADSLAMRAVFTIAVQ